MELSLFTSQLLRSRQHFNSEHVVLWEFKILKISFLHIFFKYHSNDLGDIGKVTIEICRHAKKRSGSKSRVLSRKMPRWYTVKIKGNSDRIRKLKQLESIFSCGVMSQSKNLHYEYVWSLPECDINFCPLQTCGLYRII